MENLSSRWRFRTDMSSVRSASGTAYLIFQKLQMKECTRVRSNTTPEVEWTEADSKIREIEWRNPFGFFFSATGDSKRAKNTVSILLLQFLKWKKSLHLVRDEDSLQLPLAVLYKVPLIESNSLNVNGLFCVRRRILSEVLV